MHHILKFVEKKPILRENGDTTLAMCIFDIGSLIQNSKCCSTSEIFHAISLKILCVRKEGIKACVYGGIIV